MTNVVLVGDVQIGDLFLYDYDLGMIKGLAGELIGNNYFLPLHFVPGVEPPLYTEFAENPDDVGKPMPGIPFIFNNPGDAVERYVIPCIRVRREDPGPAMERWMSLHEKYRRPAPGATEVQVDIGNQQVSGYDKYETQPGPWPYDIPYTITTETNGKRARLNAQILLKHVMRIFGPHGILDTIDSLGETRKFEVFGEGPSNLSLVADIRDRTIIYAMSLRVAGYLDVQRPMDHRSVTSAPDIRFHR
jgi:hypothetical protein